MKSPYDQSSPPANEEAALAAGNGAGNKEILAALKTIGDRPTKVEKGTRGGGWGAERVPRGWPLVGVAREQVARL